MREGDEKNIRAKKKRKGYEGVFEMVEAPDWF
jgi:hypothetical protein